MAPRRAVVGGYVWRPGAHCATSALRDLLQFHGAPADIANEAVLAGAASALAFVAIRYDALLGEEEDGRGDEPALPSKAANFFCTGWSISFLGDLIATLGLDVECGAAPDDDNVAWAAVRDRVASGRPVLVEGDTYYLWYKPRDHFPSHLFVVFGYDEDAGVALVAERDFARPLEVPLTDLALARSPPDFPQLRRNTWIDVRSGRVDAPVTPALLRALHRTSRRMLTGDVDEATPGFQAARDAGFIWTGLPGFAAFRAALPLWRRQLAGPRLRARCQYIASLVLRAGSGGAFFRNTFVAFLRDLVSRAGLLWVTPADVQQAQAAAAAWDGVGTTLEQIAVAFDPTHATADGLWLQLDALLGRAYANELALFTRLEARLRPWAALSLPAAARL